MDLQYPWTIGAAELRKNQYNPMDYMGLVQHPWTLRAVAFFGLGLGSGCKLMCEDKQLAHLGYDLIFFLSTCFPFVFSFILLMIKLVSVGVYSEMLIFDIR